ncbi:MAG: SDR family oxidoreductase [Betaproteobacteria bacterium]|nr:SDR family oxidoreductase [Betaproteobacteria bacterium]
MGLLQDKKILIMGVLSNRSIAYGIAKSCAAQGARLAFTYQNERFEQRVKDLAQTLGSDRLYPCDVSDDAAIASLFERLALDWDRLDGLVHAIAFAPREAIAGDFLEGVSREAFRIAHDVSSYSLIAVCKQAQSMLVKAPSSVVTLSYLGAERMVPNYNTMGLAKASLEAGVRYLAGSLSPQGVLSEIGRNASRTGCAKSQRTRAGLHEQAIGRAVITAFKLEDFGATGCTARQSKRRHRSLGSRAGESHPLHMRMDLLHALG